MTVACSAFACSNVLDAVHVAVVGDADGRHAQFLGEDDQLIDGSGTVDVSGNEVGAHFVAPQIVGDFGC